MTLQEERFEYDANFQEKNMLPFHHSLLHETHDWLNRMWRKKIISRYEKFLMRNNINRHNHCHHLLLLKEKEFCLDLVEEYIIEIGNNKRRQIREGERASFFLLLSFSFIIMIKFPMAQVSFLLQSCFKHYKKKTINLISCQLVRFEIKDVLRQHKNLVFFRWIKLL